MIILICIAAWAVMMALLICFVKGGTGRSMPEFQPDEPAKPDDDVWKVPPFSIEHEDGRREEVRP